MRPRRVGAERDRRGTRGRSAEGDRGPGGLRLGRSLVPATAALMLAPALATLPAQEAAAVARPPVGRPALDSLHVPPLDFEPPRVEEHALANGTPVLFLEDHALPLVDVYLRFEGGYAHFGREYYAAGTALPTLLRTGGTRTLPADSVDQLVEHYALQTTFGTGGVSASASLNTLSGNLEPALALWVEMLRAPRFEEERIEEWRGRTLEGIRRRRDNPVALAYSEFNRLVFGEQPTGWEMTAEDLAPERLDRERLEWLHQRIFCRQNMLAGVAGDVTWERARALLDDALAELPACPGPLPERPVTRPRAEPGVYVLPRDLEQSVVVMAEPGGVSGDDDAYHASRIADAILGGGGFTSRLVSRVRTDAGLAYSVSSLWTAPDEGEGIVGAVTRTRADATVAATRLILDVMREMKAAPPAEEEVRTAVDRIANGFVFNFRNAGQIVARRLLYRSRDMPEDWLERYVEGVQAVDPEAVHRVVSRNLDPDEMTILIVGDTTRFDAPPSTLGPVTVLELPEG